MPVQAAENETISVKGQVKGFADPRQSKTISLGVKNKGVMVFKYTDATEFKNFKSIMELKGEAAVINYMTVGSDNVAKVITKALVKLPKGVKEIKTPEMEQLVRKGPKAGNFFLVDARPAPRYAEGHIEGAQSIPVPKMKKSGAELLPADKDIMLVFYCGGPT